MNTFVWTIAIAALAAQPAQEKAAVQRVLDDQAAAWNKAIFPAS